MLCLQRFRGHHSQHLFLPGAAVLWALPLQADNQHPQDHPAMRRHHGEWPESCHTWWEEQRQKPTMYRVLSYPYITKCYFTITLCQKLSLLTGAPESFCFLMWQQIFSQSNNFSLVTHSHPGPAANSPRPVCVEGLEQSRCRERAGYTERSGGLHAAQTCAVPSGMLTN